MTANVVAKCRKKIISSVSGGRFGWCRKSCMGCCAAKERDWILWLYGVRRLRGIVKKYIKEDVRCVLLERVSQRYRLAVKKR